VTTSIREATGDDADAACRLLDAAMLEFDRERVRGRIDAGRALVAVVDGEAEPTEPSDRRVVGVCVLGDAAVEATIDGGGVANGDGVVDDDEVARGGGTGTDENAAGIDDATEIEQLAVHRSRRGRGIGRDLVETAAERADGALVVRFPAQVRPFYEALGFEIRETDGDDSRPLGVRE
jgi:GNAT superfamily N-acetyltransferase